MVQYVTRGLAACKGRPRSEREAADAGSYADGSGGVFAREDLRQVIDPRLSLSRHAALADERVAAILGGDRHRLGELGIVARPRHASIAGGDTKNARRTALVEIVHEEFAGDAIAADDRHAIRELQVIDLRPHD